jgi:3-phenylpropionate/cinnamic acid dioxygenase small subunit
VTAEQHLSVVHREAELLDEWRLTEWLDLWTDDAIYWIPVGNAPETHDPMRHVSIAYDDRQRLQERVARLESGAAHAQDPRSRVVRLLTNVRTVQATESEAQLRSNFALFESRHGRDRSYAGVLDHDLVQREGVWLIRRKKISLIQSASFHANLAFII